MHNIEFEIFHRYQDIAPNWSAFTDALRIELPLVFWLNRLRDQGHVVESFLREQNVEFTYLDWCDFAIKLKSNTKIGGSFIHLAGLVHIQEEAAIAPVMLLQPKANEYVLDLCAAPGNKTVLTAMLMNNSGTVIANDINEERLRLIRRAADRLGLLNICLTKYDASQFPTVERLFDKVIVDVPCSCEGTSRKNPSILKSSRLGFVQHLPALQRKILNRAFALCRPGGLVLYSTCTYAPEENECVIQDFLDQNAKDAELVFPESLPEFKFSPGLHSWQGRKFSQSMKNCIRLWPNQNDSGGFFMGLIQKL